MTEERLKEIKDSIEFQLDVCKITEQKLPNILALEEKELYDEVIRLQQENKRLKKELNKHIKEGIEKDQEIERLCNALNEVIERNSKAIEYVRKQTHDEDTDKYLGYPDLIDDEHLLNILQGSDKEC